MASAKNEAKIKFNADCKEFNQQIKSANATLKELRNEVQLNNTQLSNGGDAAELLKEQYDLLTDAVVAAGDKVEAMRSKVEAAVRNYGEGSDEVAKWRAELANAELQEERLTQQLEDCRVAIDRHNQEIAQSETATEKLNSEIKDQKDVLEHLKAAYVDAALQYGNNSEEAQTLANQIGSLSSELQENQNRMNAAERAADSFDHTLDNADEAVNRVQNSLETLGGYFGQLDSAITNIVTGALSQLGQILQEVGGYVIETGMQTETSFAKVQAVSQATDEEMLMLRNEALEVGKVLPYTLKESGDAYYYMGLAGWDAQEMAEALYPTLQLVTASGEDLNTVADIVTDNITAFGLTSADTQYMVDVLAQTMRSTNTDVGKLGQTFKYAAAPAHAAGYTLEDVALAAGLLANNGIKGSQAGTVLRQMFVSLAKPTEGAQAAMDALGISLTDDSGRMYSLKELMDQLRVAFAGLSVDLYDSEGNLREYDDIMAELEGTTHDYAAAEALKNAALIFGTRAMPGVLAMVNMSEEEYQSVTSAIYDYSGAAEETALIMQDTLKGDIDMLNASLNTLAMQLYDNTSPALRELVQTINDWVESDECVELIDSIAAELTDLLNDVLSNLPQILDTIMSILQGVPTVIDTISSAIRFVVEHIDGIVSAIKAVLVAWAAFQGLKVGLALGNIVSGIVRLISGLVSMATATGTATAAQIALNAAQNANVIGAIITLIAALIAGIVALVSHLIDWIDNTDECGEALVRWSSSISAFSEDISNCRAQIADITNVTSNYGHTTAEIDELISRAEQQVTTILETAKEENRQLREEELAEIEEYNGRIAQLEEEKLQIYKNAQQDITISIQAEREMTQEELAQYAANIQGAEQQTVEAIRSSYAAKEASIGNYYRSIGQYGSEAHMLEVQANQEAMERELADARAYSAQSLQLLTDRAAAVVQNDVQMWASLDTSSRAGREQMMAQIDQLDADAMNAFLTLAMQTYEAGGTLDENTRNMVMLILNNFRDLPKGMEEAGHEALMGMIGGMESQIPGLENAAEMTCTEIVDTVYNHMEIHSPSRVMYRIGQNTVQGEIDGMQSKSSELSSAAASVSDILVKGITPNSTTVTGIGSNSVSAVITGLNNKTNSLTQKALSISQSMIKSLTPNSDSVSGIGENIMTGINSGMNNKTSWLGSKISSLASGIVNKFKQAFDIHSPSRIMEEEIGDMLPAGIGLGIEKNAEAATRPLKTLLNGMNKSVMSAQLGDMSLDITSRLDDHMSNVGNDSSMLVMMDRLIGAVSSLATRAVELYLDGRMIATTTASAADAVNGSRLDHLNRGLAL